MLSAGIFSAGKVAEVDAGEFQRSENIAGVQMPRSIEYRTGFIRYTTHWYRCKCSSFFSLLWVAWPVDRENNESCPFQATIPMPYWLYYRILKFWKSLASLGPVGHTSKAASAVVHGFEKKKKTG